MFRVTIDVSQFVQGAQILRSRMLARLAVDMQGILMEFTETARSKTPVATGTLASSANFSDRVGAFSWTGRIDYGETRNPTNPATQETVSEYALEVHENPNPPRTGQRKFLQSTIQEGAQRFVRGAADAIDDAL